MEFRLNMSNPFIAVRDTNRKRIRGLWQRGDKYYLQVRVPGESAPRKFPLDAITLSEAKAAAELRRTELRKGNVPTRGHKPGFSDFAEKYLQVLEKSERPVKVARTIREERRILEKWKGALLNTRIDKVTKAQIAAYRDTRSVEGMSPRTINIHLSILRNVFAKAVADEIIEKLPPFGRFKNSEAQAPSRPRLSDEEFELLCRASLEESGRNGQLLHDLLRFLGYSGARKTEAQHMLWRDVNFNAGLITFRNSKGGATRSMDMNPSLKQHLSDMWERRDPESSYLFPSPERGSRDEPVSNLVEAFNRAIASTGLNGFAKMEAQGDSRLKKRVRLGFHDLRRYFATRVMELGADPQTVSRWIGHKDGGILLLKTYAQVRTEHRAAMAARLDLSVQLPKDQKPKPTKRREKKTHGKNNPAQLALTATKPANGNAQNPRSQPC